MDRMRVAMFIRGDGKRLEKDLNLWLKTYSEIKISMVKQSVSEGRIIISIWYFDEPKEDTGD